MKKSAPYLSLTIVVVYMLCFSSQTNHAHAAAELASAAVTPSGSYLYTMEDAPPVLEHGISGHDFLKSTSPKVVEFYDPKCGACQAFKSNYVEVAKKVQADKPNVEFYGVSCAAHRSLCNSYGEPTVPRIFAFPNGAAVGSTDGIQVPKGAGTIHFLSARLSKALRTPEEVPLDGEKMLDDLEKTTKRRLREVDMSDEDDQVAASADDDNGDAIQSRRDVTGELTEDEDAASENEDETEEAAEDEDETKDGDGQPSNQDSIQSERDEASMKRLHKLTRERYDKARVELKEKYMAQAEETRDKQGFHGDENHSAEENANLLSEKSQDRRDESEDEGRQYQPAGKPSKEQAVPGIPSMEHAFHGKEEPEREPTDAERNTIMHFEEQDAKLGKPQGYSYQKYKDSKNKTINQGRNSNIKSLQEQVVRPTMKEFQMDDVKYGKEKGYHYQKWKEENIATKERKSKIEPTQNQVARPNSPGSRQSIRGDPRQKDMKYVQGQIEQPKFSGSRQSTGEGRGNPRQNTESTQRKAEPPRQSIREDSLRKVPLESLLEDPLYARGAPSVKKTSFSDGQPYRGPLPIRTKEQANVRPNPPPLQHLPVGGDIFVPHPMNQDPARAKQFQEYVARRKALLEKKEKMKHPIKTMMGKSASEKDNDSMAFVHQKKSSMHNYKSQYKGTSAPPKGKKPDLRVATTLGEKVLKKIPIVKRAFKRSQGEETLNDAALSFTRGLLMGVFKNTEPLTYKKKAALLDWLDLLSVSLPPEIGLHELIDNLKYNMDSVSQRRDNLLLIITQHPLPDRPWSPSCTKGAASGGFFCGFWKLLHVMSMGFAEQAGGLTLQESSPSIRVFSAKEAGDVVREYMALFFNCEKCASRFVAQYDDCSFQRCHRLTDETVNAPAESWQEFPLWMWQVHNDISRSKSNRAFDNLEKAGSHAQAKVWERDMKAVYPHLDQCITCVNSDGTWALDKVYNHLEREYWTLGYEVDPKLDKLLDHTATQRSNISLWKYTLISLIMLIGLFLKRHRIRTTGWHKKEDDTLTSSFDRSPKKYRDL